MENNKTELFNAYEKQVIRGIFKDFKFSNEIIEKLLNKGECLTTDNYDLKKYFSKYSFIKIEDYTDGVCIIKVTINKESLYRSEDYKKKLEEEKRYILSKIYKLESETNDLKGQLEVIRLLEEKTN